MKLTTGNAGTEKKNKTQQQQKKKERNSKSRGEEERAAISTRHWPILRKVDQNFTFVLVFHCFIILTVVLIVSFLFSSFLCSGIFFPSDFLAFSALPFVLVLRFITSWGRFVFVVLSFAVCVSLFCFAFYAVGCLFFCLSKNQL